MNKMNEQHSIGHHLIMLVTRGMQAGEVLHGPRHCLIQNFPSRGLAHGTDHRWDGTEASWIVWNITGLFSVTLKDSCCLILGIKKQPTSVCLYHPIMLALSFSNFFLILLITTYYFIAGFFYLVSVSHILQYGEWTLNTWTNSIHKNMDHC